MKVLGVIGGTGLAHLEGIEHVRTHQIDTPYGSTSREIEEARLHGEDIFYLHRHGAPSKFPRMTSTIAPTCGRYIHWV